MARFSIKGVLRTNNAQFRDKVRAEFHLQSDPPPDSDVSDFLGVDTDGALLWVVMERYVDDVFVAELRDRLNGKLPDGKVLDGSRVQLHLCRHRDDPPAACSVYEEWRKEGGAVVRTA